MRINILKPAGRLKKKLETLEVYKTEKNAIHLVLHKLLTSAFYETKKNKGYKPKDRRIEIDQKSWLSLLERRQWYEILPALKGSYIIFAPPSYCAGGEGAGETEAFPKSYKIDGNYFDPSCWTNGTAIVEATKTKKNGNLCHKLTKISIDYPSAKKALPAIAEKRGWGKIERWLKLEQLRKFESDNRVTTSITGQQTNKINRLPKEFRKFIKGRWKLLDCKSSSATMLVPHVPKEEREKWSKLITERRFYEELRDSYWTGSAYADRDSAKDDFSAWTGGKKFVYCRDYMQKEFPLTYEKFEKINQTEKGELQRMIQRVQARIFTDYATTNSTIPMYDGLLVPTERIDGVVRDLTEALNGVAIFTIEDL